MARAVHVFSPGYFLRVSNTAKSPLEVGECRAVRQETTKSTRSRSARCARALLALALLSGSIPRHSHGGTPTDAERAEATYLKKMLSFVEWPSSPGTPNEPFRVCVAPDYRIAFPLSEELRGITVKGRKIDVQMIRKEDSVKNCHVLFIGSPEPKLRARLLESAKGAQMLTVGDGAGFLEAGGILEFASAGNTIQFAVNLVAAKRAGLKIDSRLLAIAQRVLTEKEATGI
jgi:hypothetical protein